MLAEPAPARRRVARPALALLLAAGALAMLPGRSARADGAGPDPDHFWAELAWPGYQRYLDLVRQGRALLEAEPPRPADALGPLAQAAALLPSLPEAHLELGRAHTLLAHASEAVGHLERALRGRLSRTRRREALTLLAAARLAAGNAAGALRAYDEALVLLRQSRRRGRGGGTARGGSAAEQERREEARLVASAGQALVAAGRLEEAILRFGEATRLAPDFAPAWFALGVALARQERFQDALAAVKTGLSRDGSAKSLRSRELPWPLPHELEFAQGLVALAQGRPTEAVNRLQAYLARGPRLYAPQARALVEEARLRAGAARPAQPATKKGRPAKARRPRP